MPNLRLACCFFIAMLGVTSGHADEPAARDYYGDPLPEGAVARLGLVRTGARTPLNGPGPNAAFSPDGKLFATTCYNRTYLWDAATGRPLQRFETGKTQGNGIAFGREGKWLFFNGNEQLRAYDVQTGKEVWQEKEGMIPQGAKTTLAPNGHWFLVGAALWNLDNGKQETPDPKVVNSSEFSADGSRILIRNDGADRSSLEVRELPSGKVLHHYDALPIYMSALSPDGRILVGPRTIRGPRNMNMHEDEMIVFDLVAAKVRHRLPRIADYFSRPVFSPDGKQFAAIDSVRTLHLWDTATAKLIRTWRTPPSDLFYFGTLTFSPDSQWIGGCGSFGTAMLWNVATGEVRNFTDDGPSQPAALLFTPDGKQLISSHANGSIRIWDAAGKQVPRITYEDKERGFAFMGWMGAPPNLLCRQASGDFVLLDTKSFQRTPIALGEGASIFATSDDCRQFVIGRSGKGMGMRRNDLDWQPLTPDREAEAKKRILAVPHLAAHGVNIVTWPSAEIPGSSVFKCKLLRKRSETDGPGLAGFRWSGRRFPQPGPRPGIAASTACRPI